MDLGLKGLGGLLGWKTGEGKAWSPGETNYWQGQDLGLGLQGSGNTQVGGAIS